MGLFGGDDDDSNKETQQLLNEQIQQGKAELEAKRQNLFMTRMDIIKSQGGQDWYPKPTSASASGYAPSSSTIPNMGGWIGGMVSRAAAGAASKGLPMQ